MLRNQRSWGLCSRLGLFLLLLLVSVSPFAQKVSPGTIERLKAGNERFVYGKSQPKHFVADRQATSAGQQPYAIVLTCADSRLPPEIIFDETLGRLFVIRVAGNVVDPIILGSVEYAAEHLHVHTLLILGHESCGAVTAAIEAGELPPDIRALVTRIEPAVARARESKLDEAATLTLAIKDNVELQMQQAVAESDEIKKLVNEHQLEIIGGVYNLHTGRVEFLTGGGM